MKPQEALKLLNDTEFAEKHQGKEEYTEMLLMCKEALEKQIPKKPIEDGYYDEPCVCPNCGSNVINEADNDYRFNCCYRCGQALDWSDTE